MPAIKNLTVIRYASPLDTTSTKHRPSAIEPTASLADFRQILAKEGIMQPQDRFESSDQVVISKGAETTLTVEDAAEVSVPIDAHSECC